MQAKSSTIPESPPPLERSPLDGGTHVSGERRLTCPRERESHRLPQSSMRAAPERMPWSAPRTNSRIWYERILEADTSDSPAGPALSSSSSFSSPPGFGGGKTSSHAMRPGRRPRAPIRQGTRGISER